MDRPDDDERPTSVRSGGDDSPGESTLAEEDRFVDGPVTLVQPDEREHEPLTVVKVSDEPSGGDEIGDVRKSTEPAPPDESAPNESPEPKTTVRESTPEEPPEPKTTVMKPAAHPMDSTVRMPKVVEKTALPEPKTDKVPAEILRAVRGRQRDAAGRPPQDTEGLGELTASARSALPTLVTRVQKAPAWIQVLTLAGMFCGVLAIMLVVLRLVDGEPAIAESETDGAEVDTDAPPKRSTPPEPVPTTVAADPPRPTAAPVTSVEAPPPETPDVDSEAEARAALERFRDGLESCVVDNIRALPGTSPAVPPSLAYLARGPYESLPGQWKTPVYSCVKFSIEGPQPFVIQWQLDKAKKMGVAIAWTDDDHDGHADAALGFTATLDDGDKVEMSEIGPLFPIPEVSKRY